VAHQSLYRTYRPQRFEDVVGQSHVTRTLRNAVAEGSLAHAYLFTGPRGTGKTTTARILAKALDCEKGPTPDFDDTCQNCVDITEGRHPDVYELDAASRTGVDAIRDEIITKVSYAATRGGWKVYIIDEVHMLSTSAFNALLKTLEEPPSRVVFVLCTTHPHKVPETIHSRCQRFDFRRIGAEDICERLALIAEKEGISVAPGALTLIAKHAAGGMRDAISTLDQLSAFTGKSISLDDVEGLLGEVDSALLFGVAEAVQRRDVAACFREVAKLAEAGVDVPEFVKSLTGHFRDLFVVAAVGDASGIVDTTDEDLARLSSQAQEFGRERLARMLDVLGSLAGDMRWAGDARLALEVALVRMARPEGELTLEALEERIAALESAVASGSVPPVLATGTGAAGHSGERSAEGASKVSSGHTTPVPVASTPRARGVAAAQRRDPKAPSPAAEPAAAAAEPSGETQTYTPSPGGPLDRARLKRAWPGILAEIKKQRNATSVLFLGVAVDADGDTLVVEFPADQRVTMEIAQQQEPMQMLRQAVDAVLGVKPPVRYQLGRGAVKHDEPAETRTSGHGAPHRPADGGDTHPEPTGDPDPIDILASEFGDVVVEQHHDEKD
jgi:DNA polymerase III subunit gamma/tau